MPKCRLCGGRRPWGSEPHGTAEMLGRCAYRFHLMGQYLDDLPAGAPDELIYGLPYWEDRLFKMASRFHAAVHGDRIALEEWRSFVRDTSHNGFKALAAEILRVDTEAGGYILKALVLRPKLRDQLIDQLEANGGTGSF